MSDVPSEPAPAMPYRILTPRLELRCYEPSDAQALVDAMAAGIEHLLPWMPWARLEPQSSDDKVALLRKFRSSYDADRDWIVGGFDRQRPGFLLGGSGVHPRVGPGAAEIGYWVRSGHERRGIATEMAGALTRAAFLCLRLRRMEIHCDSRNVASASVARKLGYREEGLLRGAAVDSDPGPGDRLVFGMLREELPTSPAAALPLGAFDAVGRSMPIDV